MMEKPLQQRIDHLQHAWGAVASGTSAGDESSRDQTFLLSIESAQAAAGAAVEAEIPRAALSRSVSTSRSRPVRKSTSDRAASPKPARRSPVRASPAQRRHKSPRRSNGARVAETPKPSVAAPSLSPSHSLSLASTPGPSPSAISVQRVVMLEGEVSALKTEVAAMREDMIGLRYAELNVVVNSNSTGIVPAKLRRNTVCRQGRRCIYGPRNWSRDRAHVKEGIIMLHDDESQRIMSRTHRCESSGLRPKRGN